MLRVHETTEVEGDVFKLSFDSSWSLSMHDPLAAVHHFKLSYDGKYLLSSGSDSNFFVYQFGGDVSKLEEKIVKAAADQKAKEEMEKVGLFPCMRFGFDYQYRRSIMRCTAAVICHAGTRHSFAYTSLYLMKHVDSQLVSLNVGYSCLSRRLGRRSRHR